MPARRPPRSRLPRQEAVILELQGIVKQYGRGEIAVRGVDLHVPEGQVLALIGPSGAGKSTLIRCINRLVEPTSGSVRLNGVELTSLGRRALRLARRDIGMIFQEYALVDRLSVMENVLSGRLGYVGFWRSWYRRFPQDTVEQAFALLERVGIVEQIDKRADQLSGGQRQRVGIARALLQDPSILLVDEPTASLDPKTSRQVMRLLMELASERGLSAIINIHDVALAKLYVPRIVGLRAGTIVFDGSPDELTEDKLTEIYGEEDWSKPLHDGAPDELQSEGEAPEAASAAGVPSSSALRTVVVEPERADVS